MLKYTSNHQDKNPIRILKILISNINIVIIYYTEPWSFSSEVFWIICINFLAHNFSVYKFGNTFSTWTRIKCKRSKKKLSSLIDYHSYEKNYHIENNDRKLLDVPFCSQNSCSMFHRINLDSQFYFSLLYFKKWALTDLSKLVWSKRR